jgi:hypothetical protein
VFTILEESGSALFSLFCLFSDKTVQNSENSELPDKLPNSENSAK